MKGRKQCEPTNGCGEYYHQELDECPKCGLSEMFATFLPFNPLDWVYDLETYPNIFTASFKHPLTGTRAFFEISVRRNELRELIIFLQALMNAKCRMIGFNNVGYDYPMLHYIMDHYHMGLTNNDIYGKNVSIIDTPWENRFNNVIWDGDVYIQQIDLLKIHHFDNTARATSLKMLEFNMCSENVKDLPFTPGIALELDQIQTLVDYNDHDVDETEKFYIESIPMIEFREELGAKYGRNFLNHSDKKIGTDIFISELEKNQPGACYMRVDGRRVARQTPRENIPINDVVFPYINFSRPEFDQVKQWLCSQVITKTKGVFEYIKVSSEFARYMNPNLIKVHGVTPLDVPSEKNVDRGVLLSKCRDEILNNPQVNEFNFVSGWSKQCGLNCIIDDFEFVFGTGGIHGSIDSSTVYSDKTHVIYDWDVAGFYPTMGAVNNLHPHHLSEQFGVVDAKLKEERAKHKKGTPHNVSLKLARNGAYGDSNSIYSPFYDPQYTMSITLNGQLLLCLLAEHLIAIPGLEMIQVNTDGLTVRCPRGYVDHMKQVCAWWEKYTCLELESAIYSRMFIRDVNNYIAEYEDRSVKRKGAYEYNLDWHQNHSQLVVPKAAEAALLHGVDIEEFITNHQNIHDFMLRTKVNRADKLMFNDTIQLQNITRYYVALQGGRMSKISEPAKGHIVGSWKRATKLTDIYYNQVVTELNTVDWSHLLEHERDTTGLPWDARINTKNKSKYEIRNTGFNVGRLVAPCNDIRDADRSNIDFNYYIEEAKKLVEPLL